MKFPALEFLRIQSKLNKRRKKTSPWCFYILRKWSVREFLVIVMQWWLRNEQKSATRVWSSCFTHKLFNVLVAVAKLVAN